MLQAGRSPGSGASTAESAALDSACQDQRPRRRRRQRRTSLWPTDFDPVNGKTPPPRHPSLGAIFAYTTHGIGFLLLAAAALVHFGRVFWIAALVIVVFSVISLREAWLTLGRYLGGGTH
jgi:hypothetical protein